MNLILLSRQDTYDRREPVYVNTEQVVAVLPESPARNDLPATTRITLTNGGMLIVWGDVVDIVVALEDEAD